MKNLIENTNAKYVILSYNDGGIIPIKELDELLQETGKNIEKVPINHKTYNRLKGISNYKREKDYKPVKEFHHNSIIIMNVEYIPAQYNILWTSSWISLYPTIEGF